MNAHQIELVQSSFAKLSGDPDAAAGIFYERLFALDPALRPLFTHDMTEQGRKLMQMLAVLVSALNTPTKVFALAEGVSKSHLKYGVTEAHYATVGQALLFAVGQGLGEDYTLEVEAAWRSVYTALVFIVKQTAYA